MPIVNIELKFNDQGAVTGARNLTALSEAAEKAQKSVSGIGGKGSASVSEFGKNGQHGRCAPPQLPQRHDPAKPAANSGRVVCSLRSTCSLVRISRGR